MFEHERQRPRAHDAPLPAALPRRRATSSTWARSPAAQAVRERRHSTSPSKFAVRGFTYALREDLLGRPIRITTVDAGLVETEFSLVRFRGDEEKASSVYEGIDGRCRAEDVADCVLFALTRPCAHERRRDRRHGAQPVDRRAHPPRLGAIDASDDPRGLDVLHLRRARRRRATRRAASSPRTRASSRGSR